MEEAWCLWHAQGAQLNLQLCSPRAPEPATTKSSRPPSTHPPTPSTVKHLSTSPLRCDTLFCEGKRLPWRCWAAPKTLLACGHGSSLQIALVLPKRRKLLKLVAPLEMGSSQQSTLGIRIPSGRADWHLPETLPAVFHDRSGSSTRPSCKACWSCVTCTFCSSPKQLHGKVVETSAKQAPTNKCGKAPQVVLLCYTRLEDANVYFMFNMINPPNAAMQQTQVNCLRHILVNATCVAPVQLVLGVNRLAQPPSKCQQLGCKHQNPPLPRFPGMRDNK